MSNLKSSIIIFDAFGLIREKTSEDEVITLIKNLELYFMEHPGISAEKLAIEFTEGKLLYYNSNLSDRFVERLHNKNNPIWTIEDYSFGKGLLLSYLYGEKSVEYLMQHQNKIAENSSQVFDLIKDLKRKKRRLPVSVEILYSSLLEYSNHFKIYIVPACLWAGVKCPRNWIRKITLYQTRSDIKKEKVVAGFKIKKSLKLAFEKACKTRGESQAKAVSQLMIQYINETEENKND